MISQHESHLVRIDVIKNIGQRFRKDLGDIDALAESIAEVGMLHPIVINENNELICGERRIAAVCRLGWSTIPCRILNVSNLLRGELDENTMRKDFAPSEVVEIKRAIEATKQRGRPKADPEGSSNGEKAPDMQPQEKGVNLSPFPEGKARDLAAKVTGMSQGSISAMEQVMDAAEKEPEKYNGLVSQVDKGEVSVNRAREIVQSETGARVTKSKNSIQIHAEVFSNLRQSLDEAERFGGHIVLEYNKDKRVVKVKTVMPA